MWEQITNNVKRRICKFMLQNSLRPYIDDADLELDSLTLDLSNGLCTIRDFTLKPTAINELLENADVPFRLMQGKIKEINMSVPWTRIFVENSMVEIDGLSLVVEPHKVPESTSSTNTLASSFYQHIKTMTVSMEIAKERFEAESEILKDDTPSTSFEGLESFSQNIMDIFSRCKVMLTNVTICLQNRVCGQDMSLIFSIPSFHFFDEVTLNHESEDEEEAGDKGILIRGCKHLQLSGMSVTFSCSDCQAFEPSAESVNNNDEEDEFHDTSDQFDHDSTADLSTKPHQSKVEVARFFGLQEAKVRYHTSSSSPESLKLDAECTLGSFVFLATPEQLHTVINFAGSLFEGGASFSPKTKHKDVFAHEASTNRMIRSSQFRQMQQDCLEHYGATTSNQPFGASQLNYFSAYDNVCTKLDEEQFFSLSMTDSVVKDNNSSLSRSFATNTNSDCSASSFFSQDGSASDFGALGPIPNPGASANGSSISVQIKLTSLLFTALHQNPKVDISKFSTNFLEGVASGVCEEHLCAGQDHFSLSINNLHCEVDTRTSSHDTHVMAVTSAVDMCFIERLNRKHCLELYQNDEGNDTVYSCCEIFALKQPQSEQQQKVRLKTSLVKRGDAQRSAIDLHFSPFLLQLDPTLVNRLYTLLDFPTETLNPTNNSPDSTSKSKFSFRMTSPQARIQIGIPVPDLKGEVPLHFRALRDEYLMVALKDLQLSTSSSVMVTARSSDIEISYADDIAEPPKPLICLFQSEKDDATPTFVVKSTAKVPVPPSLLDMAPAGSRKTSENDSSDEDPTMDSTASPFSARGSYYMTKKFELPATDADMSRFVEASRDDCHLLIDLHLPTLALSLPSKSTFESLYNRISYDLLLWQPKTVPLEERATVGRVPSKLDLASQSFYQKHQQQPEASHFRTFSRHSDDSDGSDDDSNAGDDSPEVGRRGGGGTGLQSSSAIAINLVVGSARVSAVSALNRDEGDELRDEIVIMMERLDLYYVSGFGGDDSLDYMCARTAALSLYHLAHSSPASGAIERDMAPPSGCSALVRASGRRRTCEAFVDESPYRHNVVNLALKIVTRQDGALKNCSVASVLHGLTYRHVFATPGATTWTDHLVDFVQVADDSVPGYVAPSFLTEAHVHVHNSLLEYKPLNFDKNVLFKLATFWLSSNLVAESPLFNIEFHLEDSALQLSKHQQAELQCDFVTLIHLDILDVKFVMLNSVPGEGGPAPRKHPYHTLCVNRASLEFLTCSDSCVTLAALINYIASNGDFATDASAHNDGEGSAKTTTTTTERSPVIGAGASSSQQLANELEVAKAEAFSSSSSSSASSSSKKKKKKPSPPASIMMQSVYHEHTSSEGGGRWKARPKQRMYESFPNRLALRNFNAATEDDDFCIIDDAEAQVDDREPQILYYSASRTIDVVENHFRPVTGKRDQLHSPPHLPTPARTCQLNDLTCVWRMYGGRDFDPSRPRDRDVLMELHVDKTRFQHDAYEPHEREISRTVLLVDEIEIRDRLQASEINKFFYRYHGLGGEASSRNLPHAPMLLVKALLKRPEVGESELSECRLRVSLQPIRLNIDQHALDFLQLFFADLSACADHPPNPPAPAPTTNLNESSTSSTASADSESVRRGDPQQQQIFFEELVFSPEVPIRIDYRGKGVNMGEAPLTDLVMGLTHLNCSQLILRRISYRRGLLGVDRLLTFLSNEWIKDIRQNQLPNILGGVGPIHSVVQLFQGVRDLVWMPIEQYKKDGRIMRGVQRGTASFGTSTAMATLEIANKFVCVVQKTAETMYEVVTPSELNSGRLAHPAKNTGGNEQPEDLREGLSKAMTLVRDGVHDTAYSIARVAHKEHEHKGITGAVGGVLRHIPTTVVRPVIFASKATSNLLCGMRNQILPEAKQDDEDKWRQQRD